jgi:hypothetical protein
MRITNIRILSAKSWAWESGQHDVVFKDKYWMSYHHKMDHCLS